MEDGATTRTVCVLGFGRSGTSLTMQILRTLGVDLGDERTLLRPLEGDNPRGYWEPQWMVDLNDELLAALGTSWWRPFPGEQGWEDAPLLAPLRERAAAALAEHFGDAPLRGWKDPRTTLTLPFWQRIVPDAAYVICLRNPSDAIASIQRRPEPTLSTTAWGDLWLEYTARALRDTSGRPRALVLYEEYFRDPHAQVARLAALVGVPPDDERVARAEALVERDLRHHRSSALELAAAPGVGAPARTVYLALLAALAAQRLAGDDEETRCIGEAVARVAVDAWLASRDAALARERVAELEAAHAADAIGASSRRRGSATLRAFRRWADAESA